MTILIAQTDDVAAAVFTYCLLYISITLSTVSLTEACNFHSQMLETPVPFEYVACGNLFEDVLPGSL
jgi:hypothetical protein